MNTKTFRSTPEPKIGIVRSVASILVVVTSLLLSACASIGPDPRELRIETSVSSDGQWIAVLQNPSTDTSQVKVMRMDERKWIDIKAPARTSSIRFGLNPSQLLLTSWKSKQDSAAELSIIQVNQGDYPRTTLYEGYGLGYPLELEDGLILVRNCYTTIQNRCHRVVGVHWLLIEDGKVKTRYTSVRPINYSQPNYIRGLGFYWNVYKTSELAPPESIGFHLIGWPVDGEKFPQTSIRDGGQDCDYQNIRCMKPYVTNKGKPGPFIYDVYFHFKDKKCQKDGLSGWSDGMSITPDGNFGVKSLAKDLESSRKVVYIKFQPDTCEPIAIQHFDIS